MVTTHQPATETSQDQTPAIVLVDEVLVEQIWRDAQGKVSRMQIQQLVMEAASEFAHAKITTYVPIFVRRQVREKLVRMGNGERTAILDTSSIHRQWPKQAVESVTQQRQLELAMDL